MIVIFASMEFESERIVKLLKKLRSFRVSCKDAFSGFLGRRSVLVMHTGIGKVNAALAAGAVFERFSVKTAINIGVGGAYPGAGLDVGDIAIASKEIYGDEGIEGSSGWQSLKAMKIPVVQDGRSMYFNEFPLYADGVGCNNARLGARPLRMKTGNFVTVSAVSGSTSRAREMEKRCRGICENMEGAAIAQACALYGIRGMEIRGISNIAGIRDKRRWNLKRAALNCQDFVLSVLKKEDM